MSLTIGGGPLVARNAPPSNYEIVGPKHRILWSEFPRRVRGELDEVTVFDTLAGRLLHESQILPVLYVPESDIDMDLLEATDTSTHCPFKGDASYWSVRVGERTSVDAAWSYPEPIGEATWIGGHYAFYWDRLDTWYDEDERVRGHLRDPFHRVDVRPTTRRVTVRCDGTEIATTKSSMILSETGVPNRHYIPYYDVSDDVLIPSETTSHCAYMGDATYWSIEVGGRTIEDAAWSYLQPFGDALRVAGLVSFLHDEVEIEFETR